MTIIQIKRLNFSIYLGLNTYSCAEVIQFYKQFKQSKFSMFTFKTTNCQMTGHRASLNKTLLCDARLISRYLRFPGLDRGSPCLVYLVSPCLASSTLSRLPCLALPFLATVQFKCNDSRFLLARKHYSLILISCSRRAPSVLGQAF